VSYPRESVKLAAPDKSFSYQRGPCPGHCDSRILYRAKHRHHLLHQLRVQWHSYRRWRVLKCFVGRVYLGYRPSGECLDGRLIRIHWLNREFHWNIDIITVDTKPTTRLVLCQTVQDGLVSSTAKRPVPQCLTTSCSWPGRQGTEIRLQLRSDMPS
jgi:hypothetical protein